MAKKGRRDVGGQPSRFALVKGELVSKDYHAIKVRVPADVRAWLIAASGVLNKPQWRVLVDALLAYVGEAPVLTDEKRKAIRHVFRSQRANGTT